MNRNAKLPGADMLESVETAIAGIALALLLFAVLIDVIFRSVLGSPILWLQEVSMFSFMWATFFGAAVAVRRNSHYRIDLITSMVKSPRVITAFWWIALVVGLVFAAILAYQGLGFAELGLKRVSRPSGIPLIFVLGVLPICGFSMCYFLIEKFFSGRGTEEERIDG